MASAGSLVVISCTDPTPHLSPSRYFNLSPPTTHIRTPGGRTTPAITTLYHTDAASRIGMIVVVQHTGCADSPGDTESNIRADVQTLKTSPHIRRDISVVGYLMDGQTGVLREVNAIRTVPDAEARQRVLGQMAGFGPFWS